MTIKKQMVITATLDTAAICFMVNERLTRNIVLRHIPRIFSPHIVTDSGEEPYPGAVYLIRKDSGPAHSGFVYENNVFMTGINIYPWSLKVLDYPADKYHAQRDENRADCKTEDCP
ncbi:hypothetical protein AwEntero_17690 [Enterobacterales bacterium]|nr:hypothetical protein AwEntero_17690 [Enterobacterales bacterium]